MGNNGGNEILPHKVPCVELRDGKTIQRAIDFGFIKIISGREYGNQSADNDTEITKYFKGLKCDG